MERDWHQIGKELLDYVKSNEECVHEAEYFESISEDWFSLRPHALEQPEFLPYFFRSRHEIGRRITKISLFKRGSALHERYMRYMMHDFNEFLHATHKEEVTAGRESQRESEEYALERVLDALNSAVTPDEAPDAEC